MARCSILVFLIALLCSCVAREAPGPASSQLQELKAALLRVRTEHPELRTPREISLARVHGENGWPAIEAAGLRFHELQQASAWGALEYAYPESWRTQFDGLDGLMQAPLGDTFPLLAEIDAALGRDSLVPVWDEGISIMPGMHALGLLRLRANIQLQRGEYGEAREEVARMVLIAWRCDGAWSWSSLALVWGLRRTTSEMLLRLTEADPSAGQILDLALATQPDKAAGFPGRALFELAAMAAAAESWIEEARHSPKDVPHGAAHAIQWAMRLDYLALIEQRARQSGWHMADPRWAQEYLTLSRNHDNQSHGQAATREALKWGRLELRLEAIPLLLQLRKLELSGELDPVRLPKVPDHLQLREAENGLVVEVSSTHPLADPNDTELGSYPRLKAR